MYAKSEMIDSIHESCFPRRFSMMGVIEGICGQISHKNSRLFGLATTGWKPLDTLVHKSLPWPTIGTKSAIFSVLLRCQQSPRRIWVCTWCEDL